MPDVQFHVFLPQIHMDIDTLVAKARVAQASGFEGLALMDHLAPPMAETRDMWEAMTVAGWLLAHTETLRVGHLVLCDSLRHPAVLARQVVTLDHASQGRFELGIGWGSVPTELTKFGVGTADAKDRVERLSETLEILNGLWSGEAIDFAGRHFTLSHAQQRPIPTQRIPLTIGGAGRKTLALVARHADWWNVPVYALDKLDRLRPQVGKARVSVQQTVAFVGESADRGQAMALAERRFGSGMFGQVALGDSRELTEHFAQLSRKGVERFYLWFADFASIETMRAFGTEVIPAVRAAG